MITSRAFNIEENVEILNISFHPQGMREKARFFFLFGTGWSLIFTITLITIDSNNDLLIMGLVWLIIFGMIYLILGIFFAYGYTSIVINKKTICFERCLANVKFRKEFSIKKIKDIQQEMAYIHNDQVKSGIGITIENKFRPFIFGGHLSIEEKKMIINKMITFLDKIKIGSSN